MSRNQYNQSRKFEQKSAYSYAPRTPCCKVCKDAGKSVAEYESHWPKDRDGKTVCPTLLAQSCRYCHEAGHTVKYCQELKKRQVIEERQQKQEKWEKEQEKQQQQQEKVKEQEKKEKKSCGAFDALMEDSDDEEEHIVLKVKEEFPALSVTSSTKILAKPVIMSYANAITAPPPQVQPAPPLPQKIVTFKETIEKDEKVAAYEEAWAERKEQASIFMKKSTRAWDDDESEDEEDDTHWGEDNSAW